MRRTYIIAPAAALLASSLLFGCAATIDAPSATPTFNVSDKPYVAPVATQQEEPQPEEASQVEEYYEDAEDTTDYYEPTYYSAEGCLTRSGGVNYYIGRTETWYSSNILYHYRTPEWILGDDGVYRDTDGYVVISCSDVAQGELVETSLGMGKVYDCGCADGVTDIYTAW